MRVYSGSIFVLVFAVATLCDIFQAVEAKPLKVFILVGQSNIEGHAKVGTFDYIGDDPATASLRMKMRGQEGKPVVCSGAWISYFTGAADGSSNGEGFGRLTAGYGSRSDPAKDGGKIGPEFTLLRSIFCVDLNHCVGRKAFNECLYE